MSRKRSRPSIPGASTATPAPIGPTDERTSTRPGPSSRRFGDSTKREGGKALGGIISDRLGWIETSVGALLISAPLIAFAGPAGIIAGLFVFQMTMPVTLVAAVKVFPKKPAFAFGLTCLALVGGAIPTFYPEIMRFYHPMFFIALILFAAA